MLLNIDIFSVRGHFKSYFIYIFCIYYTYEICKYLIHIKELLERRMTKTD